MFEFTKDDLKAQFAGFRNTVSHDMVWYINEAIDNGDTDEIAKFIDAWNEKLKRLSKFVDNTDFT